MVAEHLRPASPAGSRCADRKQKSFRRGAAFADEKRQNPEKHVAVQVNGDRFDLKHGSVVISAITSCTNTSNPSVLIGAGLLAKKAGEKGLKRKPWVKTSFAPGSRVVTEYLKDSGLLAASGKARLSPRRLRLHDLHRQQRTAAGADRQRYSGRRSRRVRGAFRQPEFRGAYPSAGARQLFGFAAARRRLRVGRAAWTSICTTIRSATIRRQTGLSERYLADAGGSPGRDRTSRCARRCSKRNTAR